MLDEQVRTTFASRFGEKPAFVVRAPGRVNLIGEHTDYNDGFVMPIAIDRAIWIALRPRADQCVALYSVDYDEELAFDLGAFEHTGEGWGEYVKGVAWGLQEEGHTLRGWEGVMVGDVPRGAGLSSSAALELAVARAFAEASELAWDPKAMAHLGQRVENEWVGVNCGIMDQMISAAGQEGHALLIDCRTLETEAAPLPDGTAVVVMDTSTRRGLVDSAYNERRRQCEEAARFFGVEALRDVDQPTFEAREGELPDTTRRRARHVVTEDERTQEAAEAMKSGDVRRLGQLMNQSHVSLKEDFEVSSAELDAMAAIAQEHPACHGARMTGAGFGGCAVALIVAGESDAFVETVSKAYREETGYEPQLYVCRAAEGAQLVDRTGAEAGVTS